MQPTCTPRITYRPLLGAVETERAIKLIKDFFETELARSLRLRRITAPFFVRSGTGINDDLNGIERPVSFAAPALNGTRLEIVQSLAKWKRLALRDLGLKPGCGVYTDMNAVRPDERLDATHSLYVDQWDWERVITPAQRSLGFLRRLVRKIYETIRAGEQFVHGRFPRIKPLLPEQISFLHAQEIEDMFPGASPAEREAEICRRLGAVFIIGIGAPLRSGRPHDLRAPDYDDWSTPTRLGPGLNGDIVVWNPVLEAPLELSSMGIRVDAPALELQLERTGQTARRGLLFHRELMAGRLPLTAGGGIGQSRLCMHYLRKAHIGEVQSAPWPEDMMAACRRDGVALL